MKLNQLKYHFLFAMCFIPLVLISAEDNEIRKMIEELPHSNSLKESFDIICENEKNPFFRPMKRELTEEGKKYELEESKKNIEKAKNIVPKLKELIKTGTSVFDYPGLISKGSIRYNIHKNEYRLYIGVYLRRCEGSGPNDFELIFDEKGIIKELNRCIYKE